MPQTQLTQRSGKLQDPSPATVTTTVFISNLHCPSCVASIQEALGALEPVPEFISQSIVSHSVGLRHEASLTLNTIRDSLETAGFEVHSIFQVRSPSNDPIEVLGPGEPDPAWKYSLDQAVSKWTRARASSNFRSSPARPDDMEKRQKHLQQCEQCKAEAEGVSLGYHDRDVASLKSERLAIHTEKTSLYDGVDSSESISPTKNDMVVVDKVDTPTLYKATLSIGGMTCSSCVSSITRSVQQLPFVRSIDVNLLTHSGTAIYERKSRIDEIVTAIEDTGFDATVEKVAEAEHQHPAQRGSLSPTNHDKRWKVVYAISGMTCSSCVGHVTEAIKSNNPWVDQVDVNLLSNSASVLFRGKEHLPKIQESIEDAGFDAALASIVAEDTDKAEVLERKISVRIDGMYCQHCPEKITRGLEDRHGTDYKFEFDNPPLTFKLPILHVTYLPAPPGFTVRHILQTIKDLDPSFQPTIYHPPTIEDRAREMHIQERRRILFRMVLSIIVAIPTFLIGIVFMSLVDSKNYIRRYIMESMWAGNVTRATWALFILATPVYFFAADTFHVRAIKEIRAMWKPGSRTPFLQRFTRFGSMNMLMSLGTSIAYFASVVELALAATKQSSGGMTDNYFDAVVFLTMFLLIGRFLEAYSKAKTGDAVTSLGKLRPEEAILVDPETGDQKIATDLLEIGDVVRVPHGTSPPFDGAIIEGSCNFDESSLTGESRPVKKEVGDVVYSGTINKGQPIKVKITTISGTSMLDQIINVVREGQTRRAPVERVADTITSHFVPFVVFVAIATWVIWLGLGTSGVIPQSWKNEGSGGWALWSLRFAIAVFVIACPCGIGLAAPTALFVGGGLAAKHGILVKGGGEAFQEASSLDCIVFDKTGTLTQGGDPSVTEHAFTQSQDEPLVLGIVKALEESSSHPIARALVSFCNTQEIRSPVATSLDEVPGKGLKGTFSHDGKEITAIIGNEAYMADHHVSISEEDATTLRSWKGKGHSVALIALMRPSVEALNEEPSAATEKPSVAEHRWELAAMFSIADALRPEAIRVIKELKDRGLDVWMLSGDNPITANAVGAQVGIPSSNIIAGVLPDQKAEKIKYLQRTLTKTRKTSLFHIPFISRFRHGKQAPKRATIAMVGDGINDAPALSTADLSIAIGSGSDIALSSSSFILINSRLTTLLTLLDLSRVVFRRVYFNFGWALVYNLVAMPVAAGVLYPITTGTNHMAMHHNGVGMEGGLGMGDTGEKHIRLDPVWASLAMALSSLSVVCSSLALRTRIPGVGFRDKKEVDMEVEVGKEESV